MSGKTPVKLRDVPQWYRDLPHQVAALDWLDAALTPAQREGFTDRWRQDPDPDSPGRPAAISPRGLALIQEFEGCHLTAYVCPAGRWTIGWGHTATARPGLKITQEQADKLLRDDLAQFEKAVASLVKVPLSQGQYDALVSFAYNVGVGAFADSTLLRLLNSGDYPGAAGQFGRWVNGGGRVLAGLVRRRNAERALFLQG